MLEAFLAHLLARRSHGPGLVPSVHKARAFAHTPRMPTCMNCSSSQQPHRVDPLASPTAQMGAGGSEKSAGWLSPPVAGSGWGWTPPPGSLVQNRCSSQLSDPSQFSLQAEFSYFFRGLSREDRRGSIVARTDFWPWLCLL